jgi:hypothetical protein
MRLDLKIKSPRGLSDLGTSFLESKIGGGLQIFSLSFIKDEKEKSTKKEAGEKESSRETNGLSNKGLEYLTKMLTRCRNLHTIRLKSRYIFNF